MSWIIGTIHPTISGLKMINQLHMELLVSMLGWKRGATESSVDHRQRADRGAQQILHALGKERWSSMAVR